MDKWHGFPINSDKAPEGITKGNDCSHNLTSSFLHPLMDSHCTLYTLSPTNRQHVNKYESKQLQSIERAGVCHQSIKT